MAEDEIPEDAIRPENPRHQSKFDMTSFLDSGQDSDAEDSTSQAGPSTETNRILLVDDNAIKLRFLETFVSQLKPHIPYDCAENGLQAVEAAQAHHTGYSVIFMDLSMPVMDGLEATQRIRDLERERKARYGDIGPAPALVVALTGLASGRDKERAFAAGVDVFMTKPVKFKEIGRVLDERVHGPRSK